MEHLTEKELKELREIFDLVDADHTGLISLQELRKLMTALHLRPTEQELEDLFEESRAVQAASASSITGVGSSTTAVMANSFNARCGSLTSGSSSVNLLDASATADGESGKATDSFSGNGTGSPVRAGTATSPSKPRGVTFPQFAGMMARRVQSEYTAEQLRNAFQLFESPDMPEGFVSTSVLAHALATYGSQKLEKDEIERLIAAIDPEKTGRVNYYEFVDVVTG